MGRREDRERQLEMSEQPLFALGTAKHRVLCVLDTEQDAAKRWLLQQAVDDLDQAQRFLIAVTKYPYWRD